jgi:hypothetical protein
VAAFFPPQAVTATGETREFRRPSDSGFEVVFRFCPTCGSTVWWEGLRFPDRIAVAAGAFADPAFPPPSQGVHGEHRHHWLPEDLV